MAKPKQAATLDPESEVQEQVTEEVASPAEAEVVEQRGDELPELPEGVTFQQLQTHPKFKEDWDNLTRAQKEEREKAYRDGQSAAGKQLDADKRRWGAEQQALATFDHWEAKRLSEDPYENQEYAKAIGSPEVEAAYQMGKKLRQGPSSQEIAERAQFEVMTNVNTHLDERLGKQGALSDEEKGRVDPAAFKTIGELTTAKVDLTIERGIAAGRIKDDAKRLQDAREEGRREAYDEAGLEYPGEPAEGKGHKPPEKLPTKDEVDKMSVEEVRKLQREGKLDKILVGHK